MCHRYDLEKKEDTSVLVASTLFRSLLIVKAAELLKVRIKSKFCLIRTLGRFFGLT